MPQPAKLSVVRDGLHRMALRGLAHALGEPAADRVPNVMLLAEAEALMRCLAQSEDMDNRTRSRYARFRSDLLMTPMPDWVVWQVKWIVDQLPAGPVASIRDWWNAHILRGTTPFHPLDPARWAVLRETVWLGPQIQRYVAGQLRQHVRSRAIMYPNCQEIPKLATQTLWLLTLQDWTVVGAGLPRFGADVESRLRDLVRVEISKSGWAGFWDQYIIQLIRTANASSIQWIEPTALERGGMLGSDCTPSARLAWRQEAPPYATALLGEGL